MKQAPGIAVGIFGGWVIAWIILKGSGRLIELVYPSSIGSYPNFILEIAQNVSNVIFAKLLRIAMAMCVIGKRV